MAVPADRLVPRDRLVILAVLLGLAAAGWAVLIWQARGMGSAMGLTMGMGAPLFLAMWTSMMAAMMFPAAAPMILLFAAIQAGKQRQGRPFVPTWLFAAAYLLLWALFGALAYAAALGAEHLAAQSMWLMDHAARIGGLVLILAGLYQLSPLKHACLTRCRTPLQFILTSWHDGMGGAVRMGITHGIYCLGCCWLLFVILFPLGVMNLAAMVLLTAFIFAEKALPGGYWVARAVAAALIGYGVLVLVQPSILPTAM